MRVCVACNRCSEACIFPTSREENATHQLKFGQESRISYDPVKDNFTKCDLCYIAASLLIFATVAFVTDWWLRGERALTIGTGRGIRSIGGLAHELPKPIGAMISFMLGLDMWRPAPPTEQFTYYERTISFPTWELAIGLIIITGVIKAMRYVYPTPGDIPYWISAVHVGTGVLLGVKLLDHLRYVLAPSRWPLMMSMATGWIPGQRRHHTRRRAPTQ